MMWVKVKDNLEGHYFLNTDMVSAMHLESSTVFIPAITGTNNGVLHLATGEVERIAEMFIYEKMEKDLKARAEAIEKWNRGGSNEIN